MKDLALPQNQWVDLGLKPGLAGQITVVASVLIGVETF